MHPAKLPNDSDRMQQLGETEEATEEVVFPEVGGSARAWNSLPENQAEDTGGWLETDDIGDF